MQTTEIIEISCSEVVQLRSNSGSNSSLAKASQALESP
jgi:hypothetical protein